MKYLHKIQYEVRRKKIWFFAYAKRSTVHQVFKFLLHTCGTRKRFICLTSNADHVHILSLWSLISFRALCRVYALLAFSPSEKCAQIGRSQMAEWLCRRNFTKSLLYKCVFAIRMHARVLTFGLMPLATRIVRPIGVTNSKGNAKPIALFSFFSTHL